MKINRKKFTPDRVESLSQCEIFVFGSNLEGQHMGGAARMAYERFGAEWGVGDGPTGRCYAIPTMHGGLKDIRPYAEKFIAYAKEHPKNRFLLTRVGCGIAGFKDDDMAQLFEDALDVPNITCPREWLPSMAIGITLGLKIPRGKETAPLVVSDEVLKSLCNKHIYEIGAGVDNFLPDIKIRYVSDNKKFGYAWFGNFFSLATIFMSGRKMTNMPRNIIRMSLKQSLMMNAKVEATLVGLFLQEYKQSSRIVMAIGSLRVTSSKLKRINIARSIWL